MALKNKHIELELQFDEEALNDFVIKKDSDLSKQVRNMIVLNPVIRLEFIKNSLGPTDSNLFDGVDTQYLSFSLFDFISENMVFSPGALRKDIIEYLAFEAMEIKDSLKKKEAFDVAEIVLDHLTNSRENHKSFFYSYFDASTKSTKQRSFRLINYTVSEDGSGYYFLTREGFSAYLSMYFTDAENISEMDEYLVKKMLDRENFDGALKIAKRNRKRTIEYKREHEKTLLKIKRDIGSISWSKDVKPFLKRSRDHIAERLEYEGDMLSSLDRYLDREDLPDVRAMTVLQETIQECQRRHGDLHRTLIDYNEQFLDEQVRTFRPKRSSESVHNFEKEILSKAASMKLNEIVDISDEITSALNLPEHSKLFDPLQLISLFEKSFDSSSETYADISGKRESLIDESELFSKEVIIRIRNFLDKEIEKNEISFKTILKNAALNGMDKDEIKCLSFLVLQYYGDYVPGKQHSVTKSGKFTSEHASGDNFVFRRNDG